MSRMKHGFVGVSIALFITNIAIASHWKENAKAVDISGGEDHTLVLTQNKWPWACGPNSWYQLGIGDTTTSQKTLVRVHGGAMSTPRLQDINDIEAGWKHSLALESYDPSDPNCRGYVWAWGDNDWGELGNNSTDPCTTPIRVVRGAQVPADPYNPDPNLARIVDISAGRSGEHSLAVDANSYVYGWGRNQEGQCGVGLSGTGFKELDPNQVLRGEQPVDPKRQSDYLNRIIAVSAGEWHSMALEAYDPDHEDPNLQGRVYTWGDDEFLFGGAGVLGVGYVAEGLSETPVVVHSGQQDPNHPNDPLKRIVAISAGWDHSMALEKYEPYDDYQHYLDPNGYVWPDPNHRGRVYTWGNNGQGWGDDGDTNKSNGGRLGNGSTTDGNSMPVLVLRGEQPPDEPNDTYPYLCHIVAVSVGEAHSMALDVNGYVYTWGDNQHGQLGNGCDDPCATPVRVVGPDRNRNGIHDANEGYLEKIVAISAGYWHCLAIDTDGTIWTWGKGSGGRLGLGNTIDCNTPHRIPVVYNITQETFHFTIQSAIDDANDAGDTLEASRGTYFEDIDFLTKTIILRSVDPNNAAVVEDTVIQGSGSWHVPTVKFTYDSNSILTGFTIAAEDYEDYGIKCDSSSPTISNSVIADCGRHGLYCLNNSVVEVKNCTISGNGGDYSEAGVNCSGSEIILSNCLITDNAGDGVYCYQSTATITNCIITNNSGEGICNIGSSSASITNSIISGNNDHGICSSTTTEIEIKNNWIYGNGADDSGDGIHIYMAYPVDAVIRNNTVVDNSDYGIHSDYANEISVSNCIIWGNGDDSLHKDYEVFDKIVYSCIEGGFADNISSDPCFVDADANDFHLASHSLCIDTGDPGFEAEPNETDIDGGPRVINDRVDMGADEFWATDFNRDGLVNFIDYAMLAAKWHTDPNDANYNDDFDLAGDDSIDFRDISVLCENWLFNAELWPGPMPLKAGWSGGGVAEGLSLQVAPYELPAPKERPLIAEPVDVEKLLDWLAQIWLDPETQKVIDAEDWLKLYESVKELE